jgi:HEAT repeat protein
MRNSNLALIRSLVTSVILEGFRDDQARLAELYPEHAGDINSLQPKWVAWLSARFGDSPNVKEVHPFGDAIVTVLNFMKKDGALVAKYRDSEQFRAAVDTQFPPGKRSWQSPNDVTTMSVDEMEMILSLSERKKQRFEVGEDPTSVEGDRVGKVGPWNLWMPTTRENSCRIVGSDPVTLKPNTTWCTARTSGSNLFYNYVGSPEQDITLFYVIRDDPKTSGDWLSVGFVNGKPVLLGQDGGVSVDGDNAGLTPSSLRAHLIPHYDEIMAVLTQKNRLLGGKHPAHQKVIDAARSLKGLEYLVKGLSKEEATELKMKVVRCKDLDPEVLQTLAGDSDWHVRAAIADHRSTPLDVLHTLLKDNAHPVSESAINRLDTIARNESNPEILTTLAMSKSFMAYAEVRASLGRNEKSAVDILEMLANDSNWAVREAVAQNTSTPPEVLAVLASDNNYRVRSHVPGNKNTPSEVLAAFARDGEFLENIAGNPSTPVETLAKLSNSSDKYTRSSVAQNPQSSIEILSKFVYDEDEFVRESLAGNPNITEEMAAKLISVGGRVIKVNILSNFAKSMSEAALRILHKLADDKDRDVRMIVAAHPNTPDEVLTKLSNDRSSDVVERIAMNPKTPAKVLKRLADSDSLSDRKAVARNPQCPAESLSDLAYDEDPTVRFYAYQNRSFPIETLRKVAQDPNVSENEREWAGNAIRKRTNESLLRSLIRRII